MFYGIIIYMYYKDHMPPHFHAVYAGQEAIFDLNGKIIEGGLPKNKRKLVEAWIILHKEELEANWTLAQGKNQIMPIDPLK
jgi:hypothetical protein